MSHRDELPENGSVNDQLALQKIFRQVTSSLLQIANGNLLHEYHPESHHDQKIGSLLNQIRRNQKAVVKHINLVAEGRYDVQFVPVHESDELGNALCDMTAILYEMSLETKKSAWIKSGHAELSNILRGEQEVHALGNNVVSFLARYINAMVGTIYRVYDQTLQLIGSFALARTSNDYRTIFMGEGLVGQCAVEKEQLIFSDFPPNYFTISSSLGQIAPKHIIVTPFLIEQEVVGVMELGIMDVIDQTKLELLRQVSESVAIALKSAKNSECSYD